MKTSAEKITALRKAMKDKGLDGFIVPKADEYQGEFVAAYAERLKWLSGFSGSAGAAVVLKDKACVLTDGRYALQVKQQVDTEIFETEDSVKIGIHGWLENHVDNIAVIGFDPWLHTPDQLQKIRDVLPDVELRPVEKNLIDDIWEDQPSKPCGAIEKFSEDLAGKSLQQKKKQTADIIRGSNAEAAIITLPDSIAWLLNIRGSDLNYTPAALSYAVLYSDDDRPVEWIVDPQKISNLDLGSEIKAVTLDALKDIKGPVLLDFARSPEWFKAALEESGVEIVNAKDPTIDLKSIKTAEEFEAIKRAHILDGIALTKFLYWAKQGHAFTELDVDTKLLVLRRKAESFKQASFPTIAGFGANGAVVHYRASEQSSVNVEGDGLLLVDSGGQYYGGGVAGTTDITRTMAIGKPSAEMIARFTLVLKGHIALASAHFSDQTTGKQIDELARGPLWNEGLDYAHGTGHGVGCYLAVHEESASISPRGKDALKAGMLISNEPGYYKEGEYGIRIENVVFVIEEAASTLGFETVSLAPIDLDLVDVDMLSKDERSWLNDYHARVYESLVEGLEPEEAAWLKTQTRAI